MSEIYNLPFSYLLGKKYVSFTFRQFFGKYIITGKENLPLKGPIIFAPNHVNALMDALAVLSLTPDDYATVFLARADLFNNRLLVKPLRFLKIMPAFRIRDGYSNLSKNSQVFDKCVELLDKGNALCLMPEGNQEIEKNIRPLVKGIFRIAFQAQERLGLDNPVRIVPVGIDIEHLTKYGKHIIIQIGKPMNVSEYMTSYSENQALAINQLKDELYQNLCDLTLNLDSKMYYLEIEKLSEIAIPYFTDGTDENGTMQRFVARQKVARKLVEFENNQPQKLKTLIEYLNDYNQLIGKYKLRSSNMEDKPTGILNVLVGSILLAVLFPVFFVGFLLNAIPFFLPVLIRKKMKIEFEGFISSVQYALAILVTFPFFYALQTCIFAMVTDCSWWQIVLFLPLQYFIGKFSFRWYKNYRKIRAGYCMLKMRKTNDYTNAKRILDDIGRQIAED